MCVCVCVILVVIYSDAPLVTRARPALFIHADMPTPYLHTFIPPSSPPRPGLRRAPCETFIWHAGAAPRAARTPTPTPLHTQESLHTAPPGVSACALRNLYSSHAAPRTHSHSHSPPNAGIATYGLPWPPCESFIRRARGRRTPTPTPTPLQMQESLHTAPRGVSAGAWRNLYLL